MSWQLWPETFAFQAPTTLPVVRSGAVAAGSAAATCVEASGAVGKLEAAGVVPGVAGGGRVVEAVTLPEGAGCSGAGCSFIEEKRVLEQPAASRAASDTATRPVFETTITPSVGRRQAPQDKDPRPIKPAKVAKFQPDMVK